MPLHHHSPAGGCGGAGCGLATKKKAQVRHSPHEWERVTSCVVQCGGRCQPGNALKQDQSAGGAGRWLTNYIHKSNSYCKPQVDG